MSFLKFWQRRKKKDSSSKSSRNTSPDSDTLDFDLLYQLAYMSSIAASGISRSKIMSQAAALQSSTAPYFKRVHILAEKMGYDYPHACRLVGEKVSHDKLRSFFLRFSSALSSGEKERVFLAQEAKIQAAVYRNDYENKLESLRKWTDAYSALIISAALIIIIAAVSMMIYQIATSVLYGLVIITIGISTLGSYIIFRAAPKESTILHASKANSKQLLPQKMSRILLPVTAMVVALLVLRQSPIWLIMMIAAAFLLPIGIISYYFDRKVEKKDSEIGTLLRGLGNTATAIGSTVSEALNRLDIRSLGSMTTEVKKLRSRLGFYLGPIICWQRFVSETGSSLVDRSVQIFSEGVSMGADPEEVGEYSALLAQEVNFLRGKRKLVSKTFLGLNLIMHVAIVGLISFIMEIMNMFLGMIKNMEIPQSSSGNVLSFGMFSFNQQNMQGIGSLMLLIIIVLTFADAFAPIAAEGGHFYKFFLYLSVTLFSSGLVLFIVPKLAASIFKS